MSRNRVIGDPLEILTLLASATTDVRIDEFAVVTSPGGPAITITLDPNAVNGDKYRIYDASGNAGALPITVVASPGQTLIGLGASTTIASNNAGVEVTFSEQLSGWLVEGFEATAAAPSALGGNVTGPFGANRVVELSGDTITHIVKQDNGVAIDLANGTSVRQGGLIYVRPIDGVTDDWPSLVALINAAAYKYTVVMLPGTGGEHYQCLSDRQLASGASVVIQDGAHVDVPTAGSTLTGAAWQGAPTLGATFLLNGGSPSPVVGATSFVLTTNPGIGTNLRITVANAQAGSQFRVTNVVPVGPNFTVTVDRPMNYALSNTNPGTQEIVAILTRPQDIRISGPGVMSGPGGSGFVNFACAHRVVITDLVADASQGSNNAGFARRKASADQSPGSAPKRRAGPSASRTT